MDIRKDGIYLTPFEELASGLRSPLSHRECALRAGEVLVAFQGCYDELLEMTHEGDRSTLSERAGLVHRQDVLLGMSRKLTAIGSEAMLEDVEDYLRQRTAEG